MMLGSLVGKTLGIYFVTLVVSLLVALVIKGIVVVLRRLERAVPLAAPSRAPTALAPMAPAPTASGAGDAGAVPAEHIAAIGAAVYAVIGDHQIVHIEDPHRGSAWLAEGRQAHHASHAIEHSRHKSGSPEIRNARRP
jgi:hypothetical protein